MQYDATKLENWSRTVNQALPSLLDAVGKTSGRGLILGASVLHIYFDQGWISRARATGDLDLSVGIVADVTEYQNLRSKLINSGYLAKDPDRYFRLFSPVKTGLSIAYVDLLAHPEGSITPREARSIMGVGDSWSFNEIIFAFEKAYVVTTNIYLPNPIGFLALKGTSYSDDPLRTKDLVDIVDVVFSMVGKGLHFDIGETWKSMSISKPTEATKVKAMISGIAKGAIAWDFSRAEQEFAQRGYNIDQLENEAPRMFTEFFEVLI